MTAPETFTALVLDEVGGKVVPSIKELSADDLPEGEVTVRIAYSTLNYKDGMILHGLGNMVRSYPHVPGIDFAGTVESSGAPGFEPGDEVLVTGFGVGEFHWGGYAQKARARAEWLVKLPEGLTLKRAMALGTAGFTAMLALMDLEKQGLDPNVGEVLVTGAAGGLGSVTVALLASLGYDVVASTGRAQLHDYLRSLGAGTVIERGELAAGPERPLLAQRWGGAVDAVGGATLASILAALKRGGAVAACGLAGGNELHVSVLPFLLRGVKLIGVESSARSATERHEAWRRLAAELPMDALDSMTAVAPLTEVVELGARILEGAVRGRVVIDVNG